MKNLFSIKSEEISDCMAFKDKVVVVTGGSNGIGKGIVEAFMTEGAKVIVIDKEMQNVNCDFYFQGDLSKKEVLIEFSKRVIQRYGRIDYLINNACINKKGIFSDCSYEDFNYVFKTGVTAPYMLSKLFKDYFNNASIVNISSTRALMSQPDTESYSAAKGGIHALTHALAVSLSGIARVNSISPGWIDTSNSQWEEDDKKQHLVQRIGTVEDVVNLVMFLCSEKSGFITGENIILDGGMTKTMIYNNDFGWHYKNK